MKENVLLSCQNSDLLHTLMPLYRSLNMIQQISYLCLLRTSSYLQHIHVKQIFHEIDVLRRVFYNVYKKMGNSEAIGCMHIRMTNGFLILYMTKYSLISSYMYMYDFEVYVHPNPSEIPLGQLSPHFFISESSKKNISQK